jgi:hypothetical protein
LGRPGDDEDGLGAGFFRQTKARSFDGITLNSPGLASHLYGLVNAISAVLISFVNINKITVLKTGVGPTAIQGRLNP